jgi:hypothetical protein
MIDLLHNMVFLPSATQKNVDKGRKIIIDLMSYIKSETLIFSYLLK